MQMDANAAVFYMQISHVNPSQPFVLWASDALLPVCLDM